MIRTSPAAEEDLIGIWCFTAREWGERQADSDLVAIDRAIRRLAQLPDLGRPRDDVCPGVRSIRVAQHLVFDGAKEHTITIYRVLHGSMDVEAIDSPEVD